MQVHYVADSETEQVEWFSALEGAVARIVRAVAGLEEEEQTPAVDNRSSSSGRDRDWANQLEKGFASVSKSSSSRPDGNAMVNIVGYSGNSGGGNPHSAARRSDSFAAGNGNYGGTISYGQIAGMVLCPKYMLGCTNYLDSETKEWAAIWLQNDSVVGMLHPPCKLQVCLRKLCFSNHEANCCCSRLQG